MTHPFSYASSGLYRVSHAKSLLRVKAAVEHWELAEYASRVLIGAVFTLVTIRLGADFVQTLRVTSFLLLVSEGLVLLLTVARRRAVVVDRSWDARLVTAISLAGAPLLDPTAELSVLPETLAAGISVAGLLVIVAGKVCLGRSLGVIPANRGIVCKGIYRLVRHPIYAGYQLTHSAFLLTHLNVWNVCVFVTSDVALILRAICEERTLARDPDYVRYQSRVRWRLVPGVF
jgi:protein-S-isoprenylcysteine O-methyltransferase Ste14